jgi:hypothetical protein
MKRFVLALMLLLLPAAVRAQAPPNPNSPVSGQVYNVCQVFPQTTVPITVSSSTTTQLVAAVTGHQIYVCSLKLLNSGGTSQFKYGTGTNCATGTTNLTGILSPTDNIGWPQSGGFPQMTIPASQALCITGGASAAGTGFFSYVQP